MVWKHLLAQILEVKLGRRKEMQLGNKNSHRNSVMGLKSAFKIFCSSKFISLSSHLFDIFRTESRGPWHTFVLEDGTFVHLSGLHVHTHGISL